MGDVQSRVNFVELDATSPAWPVNDAAFDVVLMSYISGSVPEPIIGGLYANAFKALRPGGRLLVHDFMVNADGLGLCPNEIITRMGKAGFDAAKCESMEMIHGMTKLIVGYKS